MLIIEVVDFLMDKLSVELKIGNCYNCCNSSQLHLQSSLCIGSIVFYTNQLLFQCVYNIQYYTRWRVACLYLNAGACVSCDGSLILMRPIIFRLAISMYSCLVGMYYDCDLFVMFNIHMLVIFGMVCFKLSPLFSYVLLIFPTFSCAS